MIEKTRRKKLSKKEMASFITIERSKWMIKGYSTNKIDHSVIKYKKKGHILLKKGEKIAKEEWMTLAGLIREKENESRRI